MSEKKTILVDMDGVLVDLINIWTHVYSERTGDTIYPSEITEYYWAPTCKFPKDCHEILNLCGVIEAAKPYGNVSGFKALCETHDVHIVTTPGQHIEDCFGQKLRWMKREFPWFPFKNITFTKHKYLMRGDILIEDSPKNIDKWTEAHREGIAICIRAAYNANWHPRNSTRVLMADDITHAESMIRRFI